MVKYLIGGGLLAVGAWNVYVLGTGGAPKDIMNLSVAAGPTIAGLVTLMFSTLKNALIASLPKTKPATPVIPAAPVSIDDIVVAIKEHLKPADATTPANPPKTTDSLRDPQNQSEVLQAINKLYDYFSDDPASVAKIADIAKSFVTKCYSVPLMDQRKK
jgi:hypothetical protein